MGYAAEYLIPSLSDVLATITLPHSVTYLLRGVNGETLDLHQSQPNHAVRHISQYVQNSPPAVVRGIKQFPLAMIGITFDSQLQLSAHSSRHTAFRSSFPPWKLQHHRQSVISIAPSSKSKPFTSLSGFVISRSRSLSTF